MGTLFLVSFLLWCFLSWRSQSLTLSSKLIHRFSEEAREIRVSRGVSGGHWPTRGTMDYYRSLVRSDIKRQKKRKLGTRYQMMFPSEGSETLQLGNDFGWLHYTWVDIGTPNVSFLVALDAGSDLFWVPCDCIQCASLSGRDNSLDKDLSMYTPAESSTSNHLSCSHELCALGTSCKNPKQHCPYLVNYYSENTSSSGLLVEDKLYLASSDDHTLVQAPVIIGCGRSQSGGYLDGIAPDGLLGLGLGDISVPTLLAKEGLVPNSFSMCFEEDDSGRIFFGDQGISTQQSTSFVSLEGKYLTYVVEVEGFCIGSKCPKQTRIQALVDSGSSFTFLPDDVYRKVTAEFDRQMNRSRFTYEGAPWEYCYKASSLKTAKIPKVIFKFAVNNRFDVKTPIFPYYGKEGELDGFCLALQSSEEKLGTIGQNMMTGYRIVFDRENLKLGWSASNCHDLDDSRRVPLTPPPHDRPENPLPTTEQQSSPSGHAVSPAVAGRAPTNTSTGHSHIVFRFGFLKLLLLLAFSVIFAR